MEPVGLLGVENIEENQLVPITRLTSFCFTPHECLIEQTSDLLVLSREFETQMPDQPPLDH